MSEKAKLFMHVESKTSGVIAGDSVTRGFVGQIEIDDWSWNVDPQADPDNKGQKVPVPSEVSFGKLMDRSTMPLLAALRSGDELTVTITLAEAAENQFGLIVELKQARLVDYKFDAKNEEKAASVNEDWKLDYRTISFDHRANQGGQGSKYVLERPAWAETGVAGKSTTMEQIGVIFKGMKRETLDDLWGQIRDKIKNGDFDVKTEPTVESAANEKKD